MVSYNFSGTEFYKRNGFLTLNLKQNYYTIEGEKYDAYVFGYFFNESDLKECYR